MKRIELTKNKFCLVDDLDFEYLNKWNWCIDSHGYAIRGVRNRKEGWQKSIYLHNALMSPGAEREVDHKDGNPLNNQRNNLRICTRSENNMNRTLQSNNTSGFKGVSWNKQNKKWMAYIKKRNKWFYLGCFENKEWAAKVRDEKAKKLHGDFSRLNFPP